MVREIRESNATRQELNNQLRERKQRPKMPRFWPEQLNEWQNHPQMVEARDLEMIVLPNLPTV